MAESLKFICQFIVFPMLYLAILLILIRLSKGPTILDRVISLDLLLTAVVAVIANFSILHEETAYINVIIILSVLSFLSTIAFAYYYEKGGKK